LLSIYDLFFGGLHYKKGNLNPLDATTELDNYLNTLSNAIKNNKELIFIDESSFNTSLVKRFGYKKPNSRYKVSSRPKSINKTLILAISRSRPIFGIVKDHYMNKRDFYSFFILMLNEIKDSHSLSDCIFIMDNLHSHTANTIKNLAPYIHLFYTPRYAPDTNAIEYYFSYLKELVRRNNCQHVDSSMEQTIQYCFLHLNSHACWKAYQEMMKYLYYVLSTRNESTSLKS